MQSIESESIKKANERFYESAKEHIERQKILDKQVTQCEHSNSSQCRQIDKCQNLTLFWKSLTSFLGGLPSIKVIKEEKFIKLYESFLKKIDHQEKIQAIHNDIEIVRDLINYARDILDFIFQFDIYVSFTQERPYCIKKLIELAYQLSINEAKQFIISDAQQSMNNLKNHKQKVKNMKYEGGNSGFAWKNRHELDQQFDFHVKLMHFWDHQNLKQSLYDSTLIQKEPLAKCFSQKIYFESLQKYFKELQGVVIPIFDPVIKFFELDPYWQSQILNDIDKSYKDHKIFEYNLPQLINCLMLYHRQIHYILDHHYYDKKEISPESKQVIENSENMLDYQYDEIIDLWKNDVQKMLENSSHTSKYIIRGGASDQQSDDFDYQNNNLLMQSQSTINQQMQLDQKNQQSSFTSQLQCKEIIKNEQKQEDNQNMD